MAQPELILDYASRRKRSAFRLASSSLIEAGWNGDGDRYDVRERLAGQGGALTAIVAVLFVFLITGCTAATEAHRSAPGFIVLMYCLIGAGVMLIPFVVQQSWQFTRIVCFDGTLRLHMGGPLRSREWVWTAQDVDSVRAIATQNEPDAPLLAEIELLARGVAPIRLFTDHREAELARIASEINRSLRGEGPARPTEPPPPPAGHAL